MKTRTARKTRVGRKKTAMMRKARKTRVRRKKTVMIRVRTRMEARIKLFLYCLKSQTHAKCILGTNLLNLMRLCACRCA